MGDRIYVIDCGLVQDGSRSLSTRGFWRCEHRDSRLTRSNRTFHVLFLKRWTSATVAGVPTSPSARTSSPRPRISRDFVEAHRRLRYVDATAEILHEFGRRGATTTNVVRLAGGARNSFYEVFASVEDCIRHGIAIADAELFEGLDRADGEAGWLAEVHAAISTFYEAVASRPLLAELFLIHSAASRTDTGREAFRSGGDRFTALIGRGIAEAEALRRTPPPELVAEGLSRSIVALATARVRTASVDGLREQAGPMTGLVGGFYLGPSAATELARVIAS
jgi:AcrR family transcriptional regulator